MTNKQAVTLRPGDRVRRKLSWDASAAGNREVHVVERIELKTHPNDRVTIHAGGQPFKPWEVERVRDG